MTQNSVARLNAAKIRLLADDCCDLDLALRVVYTKTFSLPTKIAKIEKYREDLFDEVIRQTSGRVWLDKTDLAARPPKDPYILQHVFIRLLDASERFIDEVDAIELAPQALVMIAEKLQQKLERLNFRRRYGSEAVNHFAPLLSPRNRKISAASAMRQQIKAAAADIASLNAHISDLGSRLDETSAELSILQRKKERKDWARHFGRVSPVAPARV